ncbi:MAG: hypothetical protein HZB19_05720 [Chloroflexi bacterium]|nr:hypothetical protein [Chloroflexota bacterium]
MSTMNDKSALSETTVEDFLKATPEAVSIFAGFHTACPGCYLARFCTLKDVVITYHLDEKVFFEEAVKLTVRKS